MTDPRPDEFEKFIELLLADAPSDYTPWLFRVEEGSKAPATEFGSWKSQRAKLSPEQAVQWMERGGNVGVAGRPDDALINVDIDDEDETTPDDLKPTLMARSRSRTGVHAWYFEAPTGKEIPNIPTDDAGEVRTNWQYVVAPGSYVPVEDESSLPADQQDDAGYYTVSRTDPVTSLRYDELPRVFTERDASTGEPDVNEDEMPSLEDLRDNDGSQATGDRQSALFDIEASDVVMKENGSTNPGDRWTSLFHDSGTGKNMSMSNQGLLHCWRHEVAHNGLQALAVLSDYDGSCADVGAGHSASGAGRSCLEREEGAHIWHAWTYAKRNNYIPDDDPVPYAALKYICRVRDLCPVTDLPDGGDESIPGYAYDGAIESIRGHDELNPGRDKTDEMSDDDRDTAPDPEPPAPTAEPTVTDENPAEEPSAEGDSEEPDEDDGRLYWADIRGHYQTAGNSDERLTPRYNASRKLLQESSWRTIEENDTLWKYDADAGIFRENGEAQARQRLDQKLREQYRAHEQSEIENKLRARTLIADEDFGGDANMICTENCVLEIDDADITRHEHDPAYNFIGRVETVYDPDANCPTFNAFLQDVVPDPKTRQKLQEFAGYCLHHWGLPYHKSLFLVGPTASGKSTFLDTIRTMLGNDAVCSLTPQQMASERFGAAELHGSWANIRNDIPTGLIENTGQFKELIAGDPIKVEKKRKDPFMMEPTAKHLFSANELPETETDDQAFFRRIILAAFPTTVPRGERDPTLPAKLQAEHPGILNWALEGLQRLLSEGSFTGDRSPARTEETWAKWGNSVKRFAKACIETDEENDIPTSEMFTAYLAYCDDEGIPAETVQQTVTKTLQGETKFTTGKKYFDGSQQRCFLDVGFTGRGVECRDADADESNGATGLQDY